MERQGLMIGYPEEVACRMGFIRHDQLLDLARYMRPNRYGDYLCSIARESAHDRD